MTVYHLSHSTLSHHYTPYVIMSRTSLCPYVIARSLCDVAIYLKELFHCHLEAFALSS